MKDYYSKFAHDYDEFGPIESYLGEEEVFFKELFDEHSVKTVLDCACGTGQHLFMFSRIGFQATGSDFSESMLEVAASHLAKHQLELPLRHADFRFLEQAHSETFDAIVCLSTSLPHLHSDEDLLTALTSMKNRLNPGGLLVLTQGTTPYTLSLPAIEVVVNREDFSRIFVKEHDDQFQTIHVLDLFHSPQRSENNQYDIVYRILLDEDYRRLLQQAGFEEVQIFGDYQRTPYEETSGRMIVVAR
ncbi:methylase [Enterococcus florum]|uniref:Methylase n=1 Tax=Enterococcus florum TaxID=2480627 RepID=A0A4P5PGM6_9ENTE|nr:class I SAM-dependent methyltransferase [Enterococcus florum]GCF95581.1 methylase [Enterococcus florum]